MKLTTSRAATAAAALCLSALLVGAAAGPAAPPEPTAADRLEASLERARLAESLVRSERTAVLLGELAASRAAAPEERR